MGLEPTTSPRGGANELELIGIEVHSLRKGLDTRNHLRKNTAKYSKRLCNILAHTTAIQRNRSFHIRLIN
jgi:hypothetical protein